MVHLEPNLSSIGAYEPDIEPALELNGLGEAPRST